VNSTRPSGRNVSPGRLHHGAACRHGLRDRLVDLHLGLDVVGEREQRVAGGRERCPGRVDVGLQLGRRPQCQEHARHDLEEDDLVAVERRLPSEPVRGGA